HLDEKVRPYIDLIDSLRQIGIERDVALPAIAVIGDQSSGKSSVLEALSGVALPRGSGILTRCPLVLKLKRLKGRAQWKAVISYKGQLISFDDPRLVESHIREAQNKLAGKDVGICEDPISLEISSHDVCDLTLIDLPGIARVPVKGQPDDIGDQAILPEFPYKSLEYRALINKLGADTLNFQCFQSTPSGAGSQTPSLVPGRIKHLILAFVKKNETIMLVVVPCNVDIATTEALRMAQEVDPEGKRTLAVLTKPDLVDKGTERNVLDIVENKVIPLSKGYLIVKCRGQKDIDDKISLPLLNKDKASIQCLANKLTCCLVNNIKSSLPFVREDVKNLLWDTKEALSQFEKGLPLEPYKMKIYLINVREVFNDENLYCEMRDEFEKWKDRLDRIKGGFQRSMWQTVKEYEHKHRGSELPGFSNYRVFQKVIQDLVEELKEPAMDTMKVIKDIILKKFTDMATDCFNRYPYLRTVALNKIDNIQSNQEDKVKERIEEQFKMEKLVYTQNAIYRKYLKEVHHDTKQDESDEEEEEDGVEERSTYPQRMNTYYEIMAQRLADQVPMLIQVFMLHEAAQLLCVEMLNLMDGGDVREILHEDSDVSRKRIELQSRLERLSKAQERLSRFL
ncbi:hypothetical protein JZ751_012681, partial [Albula glossodonta]